MSDRKIQWPIVTSGGDFVTDQQREELILEERIAEITDDLRAIDDFHLLHECNSIYHNWNHYLKQLSTVLALAEKQGLELSYASLYEFGAHQFECDIDQGGPYNPCIAHFFAMLGADNYHAVDPDYSDYDFVLNAETFELLKQSAWIEGYTPAHANINLEELGEKVAGVSLSYPKAEEQLTEQDRSKNLIFSTSVLNDPYLKHELCFWHLPGYHVHLADAFEMGIKDSGRIGATDLAVHVESFKQKFGVAEDVKTFFLPDEDYDTIAYYWEA